MLADLARSLLIASLAVLAGAMPADARTNPEPATAFVDVTVVPMIDAVAVLPRQTVIVRDGRIAAIGPVAMTRVPAGAKWIDGRGRYLMPGLADMHVHLEYLDDPGILKLFLAHGVTTVRSMDGRPFILAWRKQVADGALIGPSIVTAGPIIDGKPPLRDDNLSVADAAAAEAAVKEQADAGYDFIKVYTNLSPEAYRSAVAAAKRRGLPIAGHVPRNLDVAEAITRQNSIEHVIDYGEAVDGRSGRAPWHWSNMYLAMPTDEAKAQALGASLSARGTWTVPTLVETDRRIGRPEQIAAWAALPEMEFVPRAAVEQWQGQAKRGVSRMDEDDWRLIERGRANRLKLVQILHRSGAPLLAGTDTPNNFLVPGASFHDELELLVAAGLTPGEALLLSTRNAARFLGQDKLWGTVAPGKRADLLLLSANPLSAIRNSRSIQGVMRNGRWIDRAELDGMARALVSGGSSAARR